MTTRLVEKGYSVVETNHVSAVRTGDMKAQYALTGGAASSGVQNGQLLVVDDLAGTVAFPTDGNAYVHLHASEERIYEESKGRNSFILESPNLPRMLRLQPGDIFETNAVRSGSVKNWAQWEAYKDTIYGVPSNTGDIELKTALATTETVYLEFLNWVVLPNGQKGIKFLVVLA